MGGGCIGVGLPFLRMEAFLLAGERVVFGHGWCGSTYIVENGVRKRVRVCKRATTAAAARGASSLNRPYKIRSILLIYTELALDPAAGSQYNIPNSPLSAKAKTKGVPFYR